MRTAQLDAFASTHHGVVTVGVAARLGISEQAWHRAVHGGHLEQLHPGVARLHGSARTREQRILAAVWGAGPGAMASHRSAAYLWGVARPDDDPVDVILPARSREATLPGVLAHRPRDLVELHPVMRRGIPTTSPLRMLVDLGAVDPRGVGDAVESVVTARLVHPRAVRAALVRHARRGRRGISPLRAVLDQWPLDDHPGDSVLELRMGELLRDHRLPPAEFHPIVAGYEIDFRIIGSVVLLECDGYATHGLDHDQFEFDRIRDAELTAAGYVMVHFTWNQITRAPARVATRIEANVRRWSPEVLTARSRLA